MLKHKKLKMQN